MATGRPASRRPNRLGKAIQVIRKGTNVFHFQMRSFLVLTTLLDHLKFNKKLRGEGLLHSQEASA